MFLFDSIYGKVELSDIAFKIINTGIFQRLKNIKQLGALEFVFPTGNHTRYVHSIGVAFLSRLCVLSLKENHPEYKINDNDVLYVELAGLLHDVGHGPYSHVFDRILKHESKESKEEHLEYDHEYRSQILVKYLLSSYLKSEEIQRIQMYIDPPKYEKYETKEQILSQIVSNKIHFIDTDKLDYLIRDSYHLKANDFLNSNVNTKEIVSRMRILPTGELAFDIKDYGSIYDLICRRLIFHTNKYTHPDVTASSQMVEDILSYHFSQGMFSCASLKTEEEIKEFSKLDDDILFKILLPPMKEKILNDLCDGNLYKYLGDVTNKDLDRNLFVPVKRTAFMDKSSPLNSIPKIVYHSNGKKVDLLDPSKVELYQLFMK